MTTELKHTPGPWEVCFNGPTDRLLIIGGKIPLCSFHPDDKADALLVAAAPELYDVCKWLATERNPNIYTAIDKAMKVVCKVEGRKYP